MKTERKRIGENPNISLDYIVESRLRMQSVKRYLEENKLPADSGFLKSAKFRCNVYNMWPEFKKKNFLITLAGVYWRQLKEKVEGNNYE